jgi:hypothetical protein
MEAVFPTPFFLIIYLNEDFPKLQFLENLLLDLTEKLVFWTVFPKPFTKLTEF